MTLQVLLSILWQQIVLALNALWTCLGSNLSLRQLLFILHVIGAEEWSEHIPLNQSKEDEEDENLEDCTDDGLTNRWSGGGCGRSAYRPITRVFALVFAITSISV